jgi:hypothetical protein
MLYNVLHVLDEILKCLESMIYQHDTVRQYLLVKQRA